MGKRNRKSSGYSKEEIHSRELSDGEANNLLSDELREELGGDVVILHSQKKRERAKKLDLSKEDIEHQQKMNKRARRRVEQVNESLVNTHAHTHIHTCIHAHNYAFIRKYTCVHTCIFAQANVFLQCHQRHHITNATITFHV